MLHRRPVLSLRSDQQANYHMAPITSRIRKPLASSNAYFKTRTIKIIRLLLLVLWLYGMLKISTPASGINTKYYHGEEAKNTVAQGGDKFDVNSLARVNTNGDNEVLENQVDKNDEIPPSETDVQNGSISSAKKKYADEELTEADDPREAILQIENKDGENNPVDEKQIEAEKEEEPDHTVPNKEERSANGDSADTNESKIKPWTPPPDDGLDLDNLPANTTGAFATCTNTSLTAAPSHKDQHNITLSCHTLPYRIPEIISSEKIFIGVLSAAGGDGPDRRQSIRDTWAKKHSVYFLVAGLWKDIENEYNEHQDLIWLDEDEIYDGERSVLTYKTMALMKIVHRLSTSQNLEIKYAFKTDDDSFINVEYLHKYLLETKHDEEFNYWGWCQRKMFKPLRGATNKWAVSNKTYPEPRYPRYCQGAGFALSWKFLSCAAGENHIANARFMPFEDVATGLIAQRCGIVPTMVEDPRLIHMYRTDRTEERERVNQGLPKISKKKLPIPDMEGRIVQHRIYDAWDMKEHYKQVFDPEGYKKNTDVEWYNREVEEE